MKKLSMIPICILFSSVISMYSCSKNSVAPDPGTNNDPNSVPALITVGSWKISSFTEANEDKTKQFADFTFIFTGDGKLTATANDKSTIGTWNWGGVRYYGVSGDPT